MKKIFVIASTVASIALAAITLPTVSNAIPCWHGIADKCSARLCEDQSRCPGIEK